MGAEEFEALRPLLFSIAYRILGSVGEAEDAVQETWLRYHTSSTVPVSLKSFLSAVVTRISIDVLRSARVRRESSGSGSPSHCSPTTRPRRSPIPSTRPSSPTHCPWLLCCCWNA
jgi:DNA-directed RNA polymerase specialized sigma24 family protein